MWFIKGVECKVQFSKSLVTLEASLPLRNEMKNEKLVKACFEHLLFLLFLYYINIFLYYTFYFVVNSWSCIKSLLQNTIVKSNVVVGYSDYTWLSGIMADADDVILLFWNKIICFTLLMFHLHVFAMTKLAHGYSISYLGYSNCRARFFLAVKPYKS